jgi:uncharacterized membrane protein YeaQ/YmgE (transglycosylase-associated protein family)
VGIVLWIIIGLVAGWLASLVMRSPHGIFMDLLLGVIGGLVGGFLASAIFHWKATSIAGHLVVAFLGSVLLIAVHRLIFARGRLHA